MSKRIKSTTKTCKLAQIWVVAAYAVAVGMFLAVNSPAYAMGTSPEIATQDQMLQDSHKVYQDLESSPAVVVYSHNLCCSVSENERPEDAAIETKKVRSYSYFLRKLPFFEGLVTGYSPAFTLSKICCRRI